MTLAAACFFTAMKFGPLVTHPKWTFGYSDKWALTGVLTCPPVLQMYRANKSSIVVMAAHAVYISSCIYAALFNLHTSIFEKITPQTSPWRQIWKIQIIWFVSVHVYALVYVRSEVCVYANNLDCSTVKYFTLNTAGSHRPSRAILCSNVRWTVEQQIAN